MNEWIMAKKCLPEDNVPVIACMANGVISEGIYCNGFWSIALPYNGCELKNVIVWIPLPKMPRVYVRARIGAEIEISLEEAKTIFGEDEKASGRLLQEKIRQGKFKASDYGRIYANEIHKFNERYGTMYDWNHDMAFEINNKEEEK